MKPGLRLSLCFVFLSAMARSIQPLQTRSPPLPGKSATELAPDPIPEEVMFIRSDQYSFVLEGVPAVDVTDGIQAIDPKVNGLEVIKKWLTTRYHTPLDNMGQPMDFDSAAKGAVMNFLVGYEVAEHSDIPAWNKAISSALPSDRDARVTQPVKSKALKATGLR